MDTGLLRLRWRRRLLSGLFLLMSSLIPPCLGSGSLSGPGSLQQTLTLPRDRFGNPDYCVITRQHTMCNSEGFGSKCGQVLGNGVTSAEKEEIVRVHNELRARIANGKERRGRPGPQPPAADMEQMNDDTIAGVVTSDVTPFAVNHFTAGIAQTNFKGYSLEFSQRPC